MKQLNRLHEACVLVSSGILRNNITFVCSRTITSVFQTNLALIPHVLIQAILQMHFQKQRKLSNYASGLGITVHCTNKYGFPYLYWILKLHKNPKAH